MTRAGLLSLFEQFGILPTPQRVEIAGILLQRPQHMSAEHVIDRLKDAGSKGQQGVKSHGVQQPQPVFEAWPRQGSHGRPGAEILRLDHTLASSLL